MDAFVTRALAEKRLRRVARADLGHGLHCDAASNPWYEDGVSFDWTELHKRLRGADASGRHPCADMTATVAALAASGSRALSSSPDSAMVTVVEVSAPYWMQPLSDVAQAMSVFSVAAGTVHAGRPAPETGDDGFSLFTFLNGPPGQVSTRSDIGAVLASVQAQLATQGLDVHQFLSSFIIFSGDFTALIHQTAAVHKALRGAGMTLNIHFSCLMPRRVMAVDGTWWTALPLEALTDPSDVALFTTDLFYQWLEDSYIWRCLVPVRVFPAVFPAAPEATEAAVAAAAVAASLEGQRTLLFERFVRGLVLPAAAWLGFRTLKDTLPEEGGDMLELAAPLLRAKRALVGPQKWAALDLRLALGAMSAYEKDPGTILRGV